MKSLLFSVLALCVFGQTYSQITINEVDANTPGTDMAEFVELYSADMVSLDGYVLVMYNGSNDLVYASYDLDGYSITDGYFVIGNAATPNVDLVINDNGIQNGPDAVALYLGDDTDFPSDTPVTTMNLVDAVVYETNDDNDPGLLALLAGGCQIQIDEDANGLDDTQSSARVPDGGTALCPDDFVQQDPTPGETNVPSCFGGTVAFDDETTEMTLCIDDDAIELINYAVEGNIGEGSLFIITDDENIIISTSNGEMIDSSTLPEGVCRIHAIAYNGTLDQETLAAGEDAVAIATDGDCLSFASNFLTINRNICFPDCDGAEVSSNAGTDVIVCLDDNEDVLVFTNTSISQEDTYVYIVTDENNDLITVLAGDSNDFNAAAEGVCRVWGLSYQGTLDPLSIEEGDPLFGVQTDGDCIEISDNYVNVTRQECAPVEGCSDLFFSEYQEGSGNNKALEIYNPTQLPVSLADYQLVNCSNGCQGEEWEFTNDIFESATISPGDVFVIGHPEADPAILAEADILFQFLSNGDDVFALQRISTMEIIDIIGEQTVDDIGDGWTVSGVENGTNNHTLIRLMDVNEGTSDWSIGQNQWEVLDQDSFDALGSHTIIPCSVSTDPAVSFNPAAITVEENVGTVTVEVTILNPLPEDMTVDVMLTGGTAISPDDFDGTAFPITLTFPGGMEGSQTFDITIVDDELEEGAEYITLELMNPSAELTIGGGMFTLNINESDLVIPVLDVAEVVGLDADGVALNEGLECELRAVVYGVNLRPNGLQFTIIDPTDGIGVFNFEGDLGYTVQEGDSIHVTGTIAQFSGLTQIEPASIELISSDNMLKEPTVVTALGEDTESDLIRINCVQVVDPSEWTNDGSGFNVDVTDGINTYAMRIDADSEVFGTDVPEGVFTLTGIGGQFDSSSPYDEGYQILPRYLADIPEGITAGYQLDAGNSVDILLDAIEDNGEIVVNSSVSSVIVLMGDNPDLDYTWEINGIDFGNDPTIEGDNLLEWVFSVADVVVTATDGSCSVTESYELNITAPFSVGENTLNTIQAYPNPTTDNLTIDIPSSGTLTVYSGLGALVNQSLEVNSGLTSVDVSGLAIGTYYLEFIGNKGVYRAQFIKE